jgi:hypothetical protein
MKISVKSVNSDLFGIRVSKSASNIKDVFYKSNHLSVLVDDRYDKTPSFYTKAFISAKIKKEFRKYDVEINDVFFEYDFDKIDEKAYDFFISKEYEKTEFLVEKLKLA